MASRSRQHLQGDTVSRSVSAAPARHASCRNREELPELPGTRQRAFLIALIERIDVGAHHIDIHFRPTRLGALLDVAAPLPSATDDETQILSVPMRLRRSGREIKMLIGADPFATAKPDARLIKLLIRARRFNTALVRSDSMSFCAGQAGGREPVLFHAARPPQLSRSKYHPGDPRWAPAARPDRRQAAGALTSTACLAGSANPARLCLSPIRVH